MVVVCVVSAVLLGVFIGCNIGYTLKEMEGMDLYGTFTVVKDRDKDPFEIRFSRDLKEKDLGEYITFRVIKK